MLDFLRNHQRKFLIAIAFVIISSFVFFGTFNTFLQQRQELPDKLIVRGLAEKPLMRRGLAALSQILATSTMSPSSAKEGSAPNLLNDGVIEKELLENGLGIQLAEQYFTQLKPQLETILRKMRSFRHYTHPQAPHISAMGVWQRFAPQMVEHLQELKREQEPCTIKTVELMIQLYLDQTQLPPEMLKQILLFQQQQMAVAPDPYLTHANMALFGFTSLEEWFGPLFVQLSAQFIANAAALAEQRGYSVKREEVRSELLQNIYSGYKRFAPKEQCASGYEIQNYFQRKIQQLGLEEQTVLDAWRNVMLFRRLFSDVGGSVLIDPLAYQHFQAFTDQYAKIDLYEMPSYLQLRDFQSMLKLQVYLESISPHPQQLRTQLILPKEICSLDQIEKRSPELVERSCEVQYAHVKKSELASQISLRETWEWQAQDSHWVLLQKQFDVIRASPAKTPQERFAFFDALDAKQRLAIDTWTRLRMLDEMPEKIINALAIAQKEKKKIGLRLQGSHLPFVVKEQPELPALLEKAHLYEENAEIEQNEPLYCFTSDAENYYRIKVLSRDAEKHVLRFAQACEDGTLDAMLERRLEEAYPEARKKEPSYYQLEKGRYKPVKEVKDQIGRFLFADLLKAIEEAYKMRFGSLPGNPGELPLLFYSNYRLFFHVEEARRNIQKNPLHPAWVGSSGQEEGLVQQWLFSHSERTVKRSDALFFPKEEIFSLQPQSWSEAKLAAGNTWVFYKVLEQASGKQPPIEVVKRGHEILALDARRQLMSELLCMIQKHKAIDICNSWSFADEH